MFYRHFGHLETPISTLGFGGGAISGEGGGYGFGAISESESIDLLKEAVDLGINLFDTAPIYGFGASEVRMGKAFKDLREKVFLVSKCGVDWHANGRVNMDNRPEVAERMLGESLTRLNTDYIDLYMIHWPSKTVDIRESMEVLAKAKDEGKIKHIGLCNTTPEDIDKAKSVAPILAVQSEYNLFTREIETELFSKLSANGIGFMSYGTLDKGILTGRVTPERTYDEHDARSKAPWWKKADRSSKFKAMERLIPWLKEQGLTSESMALGAVLSSPVVSTALCGPRNQGQLRQLCEAMDRLPSACQVETARTLVT